MKKFKLLSSIAAVAAISCVAAASSMAASAVEFKTDIAKSTADTKVIDVYYIGDDAKILDAVNVYVTGVAYKDVTFTPGFSGCGASEKSSRILISAPNGSNAAVENNSCLLGTLAVKNSDSVSVSFASASMSGYANADKTGSVTLSTQRKNIDITDKLAVINAEDVGLFTEGEGDPAKAYKATLTGEGAITWYVRDGEGNVADKAVTEFTGGAGVVVGLVATGANVANINYATVTID